MIQAFHDIPSPEGPQAVVAWLASVRDDVVERFVEAERSVTPKPVRTGQGDATRSPAEALLDAINPFLLDGDASAVDRVVRELVLVARNQGVPAERVLALTGLFRRIVLDLYEQNEGSGLASAGRAALLSLFERLLTSEATALAERLDTAEATLDRRAWRDRCAASVATAAGVAHADRALPGVARAMLQLIPLDRLVLLLPNGQGGAVELAVDDPTTTDAETAAFERDGTALRAVSDSGVVTWCDLEGSESATPEPGLEMPGARSTAWIALPKEAGLLGVGRLSGTPFRETEVEDLKSLVSVLGPAAARWGDQLRQIHSRWQDSEAPTPRVTAPRMLLNAAGHIVQIHEELAARLGSTCAALAGRPFSALVAPESHLTLADVLTRVSESDDKVTDQLCLIAEDGQRWTASVTTTASRPNGELTHFTLLVEDERDRSDAERTVQRMERSFTTVVEHLPCMVLSADRDGGMRINPRVASLTGYTDEDFSDDPLLWLTMIHPADRKATLEKLRSSAADGAIARLEFRIRHRNGRAVIRVAGYAAAAFDGAGLRSLDAVLEDVTGRDAAHKALQDALQELKDTRGQVQTSRTRLARTERLAAVGQVAAGVAHEIATPLSWVAMNLKALEDEAKELRDEFAHTDANRTTSERLRSLMDLVRETSDGIDQIRRIAGDLGCFTRLRRRQVRPTDIHNVIEAALGMVSHMARGRCAIERDFDRTIPAVPMDEGRVRQVMLNLVLNATQAIGEAGDPTKDHIRVTTRLDGDHAVVEIKDSGPGIRQELLSRVFEPFYSTKGEDEGTGLGLSIVREIICDHGGEVLVDSTPGEGARLTVTLPLEAKARAEEPPPVEVALEQVDEAEIEETEIEEAEIVAGRARVLVVDDDPRLLRAVSRLLRADHDVETASGISEARKAMERNPHCDLVLLDSQLADGAGADFYSEAIARWPELQGRITFFTGDGTSPRTRRLIERDGVTLLTKPVEPEALRNFVTARIDPS